MTETMIHLREIAGRASRLAERQHDAYTFVTREKTAEKIAQRLEKWSQAVAKGEPERLRLHLDAADYTLDELEPLFGDVVLAEEALLPDWTAVIREIVHEASQTNLAHLLIGESHPAFVTGEPTPFEDLLLPILTVARRRLEVSCSAPRPCLEAAEAQLLIQLQRITTPTLNRTFWLYRVRRKPILAMFGPKHLARDERDEQGELRREQYVAFVQEMLTPEKLWPFLTEYSAMARLLAETVLRWVTVMGEFYSRLAHDLPTLQTKFSQTLHQVTALSLGLSDSHLGGRSVIIVTFDGDFKLVYKPHSLAIEQAYQTFVEWVNGDAELLPLATLNVLDCQSHGWVGFVQHAACHDEAAVKRYFERSGMLLCLMYVLSGTDYHIENIIVNGEQPIPIDLEMIFYPPTAMGIGNETQSESSSPTVLNSLMLPFGLSSRLQGMDISFFGASADKAAPITQNVLHNINTDSMRWEDKEIMLETIETPTHLLYLEANGQKQVQNSYQHRADILRGFEKMYRFLLARQALLLNEGSPLEPFNGLKIRFLARATQLYFRLLVNSFEPDVLREGMDRYVYLKQLGRGYTQEDANARRFARLLDEEHQALTETDIPFFEMTTDSLHLTTPDGQTIKNAFARSGYDHVRGIVAGLSEADLAQQRFLIRQTLVAKGMDDESTDARLFPTSTRKTTSQGDAAQPADFLAAAEEIAEMLMQTAVYDGQRAAWTQIDFTPDGAGFANFVEDHLYSGRGGIALFFAALASVNGENSVMYRRYAYAALAESRERLAQGQRTHFLQPGIGAAVGAGSLAYVFLRCANWLEDDDLLEEAKKFALLMTPELIAQDEILDVLAGAAGAILSLLPLYAQRQDRAILGRLIACADRLVETQQPSEQGGAGWVTNRKMLTGFSHGAAGISYALLKMFELTGNGRYLQAAKAGIAYEQTQFVPEANNWQDLRTDDERMMTAWCNGAAGIGMARLAGQPIFDNEQVRADIVAGFAATETAVRKKTSKPVAHLCCGDIGLAEILQKSPDAGQRQVGLELATAVLKNAQLEGGYRILEGLPFDLPQPSFFQGIAGVGYTFLRLAQATAKPLPSVLLWE
ncbi:MAG: type 2 lanthipeptide synthetase LanM family protein [Chloroflexota bacterium]